MAELFVNIDEYVKNVLLYISRSVISKPKEKIVMEKPWLIQRLEIKRRKPDQRWEVDYDYMGSAEFEWGAQRDSLRRIFTDEFCEDVLTVTCEDEEVVIFMLAKFGFDFKAYQPYLQQLADDQLRLKEVTYFSERVRAIAGKSRDGFEHTRTNGWFDIDNDVLWTLTPEHRDGLLERLKEVKVGWAQKASEKK